MSMRVKGKNKKGREFSPSSGSRNAMAAAISPKPPWDDNLIKEPPSSQPSAEVVDLSKAKAEANHLVDSVFDNAAYEAWLAENTGLYQLEPQRIVFHHPNPAPRMARLSTDGGQTWKLREINKPMCVGLMDGDRWGDPNGERSDEDYPTRAKFAMRTGRSVWSRKKVKLEVHDGPLYCGPTWSRELSTLYRDNPIEGFEKSKRPPTFHDVLFQYWKDLETHSLVTSVSFAIPMPEGYMHHGEPLIESVRSWKIRDATWWEPTLLDDIGWEDRVPAQRVEVELEQQEVYERTIHPFAGDPALSDELQEELLDEAANNDAYYYDNGARIEVENYATSVSKLEADLSVATERSLVILHADGKKQNLLLLHNENRLEHILPSLLVQAQTLALRKIKENVAKWREGFLMLEDFKRLTDWLHMVDVHNRLRSEQAPVERGYSTEQYHIFDRFFKGMQARTRYPTLRITEVGEPVRKRFGKDFYWVYETLATKQVPAFTASPPVYRKFPPIFRTHNSADNDEARYTLWTRACALTEGLPVDFELRTMNYDTCVRISKKNWEYLQMCHMLNERAFKGNTRNTIGESNLLTYLPEEVGRVVDDAGRIEPVITSMELETPADESMEINLDKLHEAMDKAEKYDIEEMVRDPVANGVVTDIIAERIRMTDTSHDPIRDGMSIGEFKLLVEQYEERQGSGILVPKNQIITPQSFREAVPEFGRKRESFLSKLKKLNPFQ